MYGHGGVVIYCCLRGLCVFCVERERERMLTKEGGVVLLIFIGTVSLYITKIKNLRPGTDPRFQARRT